MKKNLVKKDYLTKIKEIQKHNKSYYDENKPSITDQAYDILKNEIFVLEKKYPFLKNEKSPSNSVGYTPSKNFKKIKHKVPMLSLANAFDETDLLNFEKKMLNFLSMRDAPTIEYSAEPKIDGISASLTYINGKFIKGLSRGDGKEGEDITKNLNTINDIPKFVKINNFPSEIDIRGEVFINNSDFKKIKDRFANPRNAASGSLRQKDPMQQKKYL